LRHIAPLGRWKYGDYIDFDSVEFGYIRIGNGRLQGVLRPVWPCGGRRNILAS